MLIGISAFATVGKDTFASLLTQVVSPQRVTQVAFAQALKKELDPLFRAFGETAFETDPVKKTLIRPILVSHGMSQRVVTNGRYWVDKVEPTVKEALKRGDLVIVTDVRFENEIDWLHSLGGKSVYLNREGVNAPNEEEARNDPIMRAKADYLLNWPTLKKKGKIDLDSLKEIVHAWWTSTNTLNPSSNEITSHSSKRGIGSGRRHAD